VARAFDAGLARFEFLGLDEPWKLLWTDTTRTRTTLRAFGRTPGGTLGWAAHAYGRPAAKRLGLGRLRRLGH
jgi:hypothetical protein